MISNVYLFQPQFPVKLKNTVNYWLPYSAACIWSYVHLYPELTDRFDLKELYFKRENYQKILDHLENPKVVGFSCYLWNDYKLIVCARTCGVTSSQQISKPKDQFIERTGLN